MADIEIFTKPTCPYCAKAKKLLEGKGASWREFDIVAKPELRDVMIGRASGRTTVPQIFIDGRHIGGCDDIHALEASGSLDHMLQGQPA